MFYLEAHNDVWGSLLALGHDVVHVELVGHLLTDVVHDRLHLDGDLYIIGAVCVSVSKSHYLCIQRICFQTLLNSRDLFVSHVYRQLDNKNPKMYIKIPRCS